jgi:hypothetical protein
LRKFLNRQKGTANVEENERLKVKSPLRKVSLVILFKQQYSERIIATRDRLLEAGTEDTLLKAYNAAVGIELAAFREEAPDDYHRLAELAEEMKQSAAKDFEGQSSDVQNA